MGLALLVQQTKSISIGEQGTGRIVFAETSTQFVERSVEIDNVDAGGF